MGVAVLERLSREPNQRGASFIFAKSMVKEA